MSAQNHPWVNPANAHNELTARVTNLLASQQGFTGDINHDNQLAGGHINANIANLVAGV